MTNPATSVTIFLDELLGQFLRWPIWWYGAGLVSIAKSIGRFLKGYARSLGLKVWLKNLFVPMYGMYDWQSRMISFFMRVVQIIGRGIAFIFLAIFSVIFLVIYLLLPPVVLIGIIYHVFGFYVA
ncbi:MAG: hypothetical protein WCT24_03660 [Patescibacteria group bacterium]|jgi:hypothetical protein